MTREAPQLSNVLAVFRAKTVGMNKGSLETVAAGNPSLLEEELLSVAIEMQSRHSQLKSILI